jgi:hypothetical protein
MTSLENFLNLNKEFEFEGKKYTTAPLDDIGEGVFSVWLEQRAYDAIERRTYQDEKQKIEDRRTLTQDVAIGLYEYGGVLCFRATQWPPGIAKVIEIICKSQGMTEAIAKRFVNHKLKEIAVTFVSQLPNVSEEAMGTLLNRYGLPGDYFTRDLKPETAPAPAPVPSPEPAPAPEG